MLIIYPQKPMTSFSDMRKKRNFLWMLSTITLSITLG
jgi:hypothetical protein